MIRRTKVALAAGFFLLLTNGCGIFYYVNESPAHRAMRLSGYDLCHLKSCGPIALSNAFKHLGLHETTMEIGKDIQDNDKSHYREILAVVSHKFNEITCPPELERYCKHRGFKVTVVNDINRLATDDVAIILIKGHDDFKDWHWICYPENSKKDILNYFGNNTRIKGVYILNK